MQRPRIVFSIYLGLAVLSTPNAMALATSISSGILIPRGGIEIGAAKFTDPLLVNGWGLAYGPGGPFWVSDQGSGWSTLYDGHGVKKGLEVLIPSATGAGPGQPTGIVFNGIDRFSVGGMELVLPVRNLRWNHQRLGSSDQSQRCDHRSE